jgi:hypothetical protein
MLDYVVKDAEFFPPSFAISRCRIEPMILRLRVECSATLLHRSMTTICFGIDLYKVILTFLAQENMNFVRMTFLSLIL